ncbi:hypothetical protein [Gracilibacillus kekensis]|uniref:Tox-SHH domain-containing protein n=1 Tax=Gracilibacillus kekensis TaxID=1027249 RepID=A0A1M7KJL4_9BACI|nr:hypothetical protein [Gracilibacillus kekensis]SHM65320.1 hypothetical protein SAMN05216179_0732 [Gracilibacillus kekensis]
MSNPCKPYSDIIHGSLDAVGLVPGIGIIADSANALYYAVEGDYKNAGLSALAAVPVVGYVGNGIKYGSKVADISKTTRSKGKDVPSGGAYKDVPSNGGEVHHMPANSVSPLSRGNGPGVRMETIDHRQTASWGNSREARAYRAQQKSLIEQGKFNEAQNMDIIDLRNKFGNKYNEGIRQMLEYTKRTK